VDWESNLSNRRCKAHETGKFEWLIHPAGESQKVRGDISIVNKNGAVLVRPLFPETLVETGFNHDFPEKMILNEVLAPKEDNVKEQENIMVLLIQNRFVKPSLLPPLF
jgi:hypothetical protein